MVIPNESLPGNPLAKVVDHYFTKARAQLQTPGFVYAHVAPEVHRCAEKATNQLAAAQQKDKTPDLLVVDSHKPALWVDVIDALLKAGYAALGTAAVVSGKPARVREASTPLARSLDALDGVRRRLTTSINGNGAQSDLARELRGAIFGGRIVTRTRASYETEYELVIAALRELEKKDRAPNGVRRMLPLVESALANLKSLPPTIPGRQPASPEPPPVDVQVTTLALHLALGDLLSHASSTATDARLNSMSKVLNVRRAGEVGPIDAGKKNTAEKTAAEEAVSSEPVEASPQAAVVTPGPVASGTAGALVNGADDGQVAAVVEEAVRERRGRHGRRGE